MTRHSEIFKMENGAELKIEITAECSTDEEMRETLSFIALSSRRFYLQAAEKIKQCVLKAKIIRKRRGIVECIQNVEKSN